MNKKPSKRTRYLLALIIPALILISLSAGCSPSGSDNSEDDTKPLAQANEIPDEEKTLTVELFFGDEEAILEDTPGEYGYVTPVHRSISYSPDEATILSNTLEALISGPEPDEIENGLKNTIPETTKVLDVIIEEGTATVELSLEVITDSPGGTVGGAIFKGSMVYTSTQFPSVDNLQVHVEGVPWNDGHSIWSNPLSRENLELY